jgi:hypothetical protein
VFAFLVQGLPAGLYYTVIANPNAFALIGSLFEGGIAVPFQCERGPNDRLVLLTIDGITDVPLHDVTLTTVAAVAGNPNPFSQFPWADSCPFPLGTRRELIGSQFFINPSPAPECDPTVAVRETSWEKFKALYR